MMNITDKTICKITPIVSADDPDYNIGGVPTYRMRLRRDCCGFQGELVLLVQASGDGYWVAKQHDDLFDSPITNGYDVGDSWEITADEFARLITGIDYEEV